MRLGSLMRSMTLLRFCTVAGAKIGSSGGSNSRRSFLMNLSQFQRFLHDCKCEKPIRDGKAAVIFNKVPVSFLP
jgi:hypothetical protein